VRAPCDRVRVDSADPDTLADPDTDPDPRPDLPADPVPRPTPAPAAPRARTLVVPALFLLVFGALTWQILANGPVVELDHWVRVRVLARTASAPGRATLPVTLLICDLGNWQVAGGVLLVVSAALTATGWRSHGTRSASEWRSWPLRPLIVAVAAVAPAMAIVLPLKALIRRPGPFTPPGAFTHGFFPSGHTVTALVCYGCAAYLVGTGLPALSNAPRLALRWGTGVLVAGIGLCLVWCDYHWISDVLAGAALGGLVLWLVTLADAGLSQRRSSENLIIGSVA
jgi:membrane-associated phospholipid phosphatase